MKREGGGTKEPKPPVFPIPARDEIAENEDIVHVSGSFDDEGRCQFTAFWRDERSPAEGGPPDGVRGQVFHTNLVDWVRRRHELEGKTVTLVNPPENYEAWRTFKRWELPADVAGQIAALRDRVRDIVERQPGNAYAEGIRDVLWVLDGGELDMLLVRLHKEVAEYRTLGSSAHGEPMGVDAAVSVIGEGMHTAFRKAGESRAADTAHVAITHLEDGEWGRIVRWFLGGLETMGIALVQRDRRDIE